MLTVTSFKMAFGLLLLLLTCQSIIRVEASATTGIKNYTILASLGETVVPPLLNISRHRHADYLMLTTSKYHVRIQKLTSDRWTQSCFKETEWYQRCQSWVNMTYLGNDMVAVEITAGNESMSGVFRVYLHCTGASKTCSSDPLMEVTLIIRDKVLKTNVNASVLEPTVKTKETSAQPNRRTEAKPSVLYTLSNIRGLQLPELKSKEKRNRGFKSEAGASAVLQAVLLLVMAVAI
ncbi:uncharacterized protein LOC111328090 [Stylophora pistillata]|uniref:uncharacterized protein LOC111328090 n=1 Tax=Stylophora pistillata TaxID=50429 RepID=UPI000C054B92|nr:uncharacterized protein LOC111328090 [Stylophora pistillata]